MPQHDIKNAAKYLRAMQHPNTAGTMEEIRRLLHQEQGGRTLLGVAILATIAIDALAEDSGKTPYQIIDRLEYEAERLK